MTLTAELQFYVGQYVQSVHTGSGAHWASCSVGIGVQTAEGRGDSLPLTNADDNNEWSYTYTVPYAFLACTGTTLPVPYAPVAWRFFERSEPNALQALKTLKMAFIMNELLSVTVHELTKTGSGLCAVTIPEERPLPWFAFFHECEDSVNILP